MSLDHFDHMVRSVGLSADIDPIAPIDGLPAAAGFLKALGHEGRLAILCHLTEGERSVTALERLLGQRQAAVSQQLARLRLEGLVTTRREGKAIYYAIRDPKVLEMVRLLQSLYAAKP